MTFDKALAVLESEEAAYKACIKERQAELKATSGRNAKAEIKEIIAGNEAELAVTLDAKEMVKEALWLTSKFGLDGTYRDVPGLCKIATTSEIADKNYSLTPGAYVGVAEAEDDGVDFNERMKEIHEELARLNEEANGLMKEILKEWRELA